MSQFLSSNRAYGNKGFYSQESPCFQNKGSYFGNENNSNSYAANKFDFNNNNNKSSRNFQNTNNESFSNYNSNFKNTPNGPYNVNYSNNYNSTRVNLGNQANPFNKTQNFTKLGADSIWSSNAGFSASNKSQRQFANSSNIIPKKPIDIFLSSANNAATPAMNQQEFNFSNSNSASKYMPYSFYKL